MNKYKRHTRRQSNSPDKKKNMVAWTSMMTVEAVGSGGILDAL